MTRIGKRASRIRAGLIGFVMVYAVGASADESIVNSKHDLSARGPGPIRAIYETEICIFCHTPHNAAPTPDKGAPKPDLDLGHWYQANLQECNAHGASLGKANTPSTEGARCMSGETRPPSGIAQGITFAYGCWPNCAGQPGVIESSSSGGFCYHTGQKKDGDKTDRTVGCFCR